MAVVKLKISKSGVSGILVLGVFKDHAGTIADLEYDNGTEYLR